MTNFPWFKLKALRGYVSECLNYRCGSYCRSYVWLEITHENGTPALINNIRLAGAITESIPGARLELR